MYRDRILNTCYRFVPNLADAEDIAQEVFLAVHQTIGRFRGEAKLSTWLYRIAVTKCLDWIRKSKRKKRFGIINWISSSGTEPLPDPPAPQPDPQAYTETREQLHVLLSALDSLARSQRIAFTLSKCDGLSGTEIAGIMGVSLSAVESLIHRARKNLEKNIYAYYKKNL